MIVDILVASTRVVTLHLARKGLLDIDIYANPLKLFTRAAWLGFLLIITDFTPFVVLVIFRCVFSYYNLSSHLFFTHAAWLGFLLIVAGFTPFVAVVLAFVVCSVI